MKKYNARNAAAVPVRPPLTVGGVGIATLQAAVEGLPDKMQELEDALRDLRDVRRDLRDAALAVDANNKRWYVALLGEFPEGSAGRDALNQIDTGSPATPPSGSSSSSSSSSSSGGTLPTAPQNGTVATGPTASGAVVFTWEEVAGATSYRVYRDGALLATVTVPPAELDGFTSGESVTLIVRAVNAAGEGPASEPVTGPAG